MKKLLSLCFLLAFSSAAWAQSASSPGSRPHSGNLKINKFTANQVGIGTITPIYNLDLNSPTVGGTVARFFNPLAGTGNYADMQVGGDQYAIDLVSTSSTWVTSGWNVQNGSSMGAAGPGGLSVGASYSTGILRFYTGGSASGNQRMTILSTGYVGIGQTSPQALFTVGGSSAGFEVDPISLAPIVLLSSYNRGGSAWEPMTFRASIFSLVSEGNSAGITQDVTGHFKTNGTTPTITSGACGSTTNGTIGSGSTDQAGNVVIASAATSTCTINFGATWTAAPSACTISPGNAAAAAATTLAYVAPANISTSQWVISGAVLASTTWEYHCY